MSLTPAVDEDPVDADAGRAGVLIVDDLPEKLLAYRAILEDPRHDLVAVRTGAEALRHLLQRDFAVILLDVNMPDMDGLETAALVRRYRRSAHTPIIFITSYVDDLQMSRGYSLGAVDFIPSPVVPQVLQSKVRVFVELHLLQRRIARQAEERIALLASEAALKSAEESTRRSHTLAELSRALSGLVDVGAGMAILLDHVVPSMAGEATLVILDEQEQVQRALRRAPRAGDGGYDDTELPPGELPTANLVGLQRARDQAAEGRLAGAVREPGLAQTVPLVHGERLLGCLWVGGEVTPLGAALLDEAASRAAIAFASARLYGNLQVEIGERRQAEARLEESARRKDEFLAMLSHELRNPLAPILNAVQVMRMVAPAEPKLRWAADVIDRQVRHLTRLVDELLDVARIRQGKIVLQTAALDLAALVARCVDLQQVLMSARRQDLSMDLPGQPLWMNGDATRLAQVINNLLTNASKYTPEGGMIQIALERQGTQAVFSVRDSGIGIEPELLPDVFELFVQGKQAPDRSLGGLGVGLTLVQRLVNLHGGSVQARSEGAGKGAEFRVVLPCLPEEADEADAPGAAVANPLLDAASRRILVVDDNEDIVETTGLLLRMSGHEVRLARDGLQALACAAEFLPDIVLLDIGLPVMDGYEVARRLRGMPSTAGVRLIALTGYGQSADRRRGEEAGFDGHLLKPVDMEALGRAITG